ncbi:hypothetical protein C4K03_1108 [Pseudomonas synxantha]|uniref:Uncharacterized protein n=1 Tax=Pseudomonas synxantha TaxID=47883 RepID=A0A3G7U3Y7_9PSED|nr:hypothetical protein [Pseudomonas synxantha]AZE53279.1 hypothetical protein C4K03_1108 [Pseudomonas synxantha]
MKANPVRLAQFSVETDLKGTQTRALYVNGRHQCKVYISIVKQVEDESGWKVVPLTPAEASSATLQLYSTNPASGLPAGWHCDTWKNSYDSGLLNENSELEDIDQKAALGSADVAPKQLLERYLRIEPGRSNETRRFMASIRINGKIYTTNYTDDDTSFNSYVEVTPTVPYVLKTAQLQQFIDHTAFEGDIYRPRVKVYYWQPPPGLYFVESLGLSDPLSIPNEGSHFQTAFLYMDFKGGVVVGKNSLGSRLFLSQIHKNVYPDKDPEVEFNLQPTAMRAVALHYEGGHGDSKGTWQVVDNFGCQHSFRLVKGDYQYPIKITD